MTEFAHNHDHDASSDTSPATYDHVPRIARVSRTYTAPNTANSVRPRPVMAPPASRGASTSAPETGSASNHEVPSSPSSWSSGRRAIAVGMAAAVALTGCSTEATSEEIREFPPAVRYDHDYAGGYADGPARTDGYDTRASGQDGCLTDSPYDPTNGPRKDSASVLLTPEGNIQVVPTNEAAGAPLLTFLNPENTVAATGDHPLVPADDATKGVLDAYGCETQFYERHE